MSNNTTSTVTPLMADEFIPASSLPAALLELTGDPGPGHRAIVQGANDTRLAPPMERRGGTRFWGCYRSKLPLLAAKLGIRAAVTAPSRSRQPKPKASEAASQPSAAT